MVAHEHPLPVLPAGEVGVETAPGGWETSADASVFPAIDACQAAEGRDVGIVRSVHNRVAG